MNYEELVKALRYCAESGDFNCNKDCPMYPNYPKCLTKMDMDAAAAIEDLQAEVPKRGKWERELDVHDEPFYQCSVCGECFDTNRDSTHEVFKYCPDCGAKMEVQDG